MWVVTTQLDGTALAPCQGVILGPAASASHGDLLETWNPRLWPQPTESESAFSQDPRVPRWHIEYEPCCLSYHLSSRPTKFTSKLLPCKILLFRTGQSWNTSSIWTSNPFFPAEDTISRQNHGEWNSSSKEQKLYFSHVFFWWRGGHWKLLNVC